MTNEAKRNEESALTDLLCVNSSWSHIGYAKAHKHRIKKLLMIDGVPERIKRQLRSVWDCLNNEEISAIKGLDRLIWCLDEWEKRYANT